MCGAIQYTVQRTSNHYKLLPPKSNHYRKPQLLWAGKCWRLTQTPWCFTFDTHVICSTSVVEGKKILLSWGDLQPAPNLRGMQRRPLWTVPTQVRIGLWMSLPVRVPLSILNHDVLSFCFCFNYCNSRSPCPCGRRWMQYLFPLTQV